MGYYVRLNRYQKAEMYLRNSYVLITLVINKTVLKI